MIEKAKIKKAEKFEKDGKMKKELKKETEKTKEAKETKKIKLKREIVVPGEVIGVGSDLLPGEGTQREEKEIISTRFGLFEQSDKLVKVISINGAYFPRRGNIVIAQVTDLTFNGWLLDIGAPYRAFLPLAECFGRIDKRDLADHFTFGDMLVVKIKAIKGKGIDVTTKERGLKKLEGGMVLKINPTKVPRVIGRAGSMVNIIKEGTKCQITVGQNGLVWIRGETVDDELLAKEVIEKIAKKSLVDGLTDQIKDFLEKKNKKSK